MESYRNVIAIDDVLVSSALSDEFFLCDIALCKGACCVEGDIGAPLEETELPVLEDLYQYVEPYLLESGKKAISEQGFYTYEGEDGFVTPLVNGKECAYATFESDGTAKCGIEKAYLDGKISFRKPISCHLYPVRVSKRKEYEALNYDEWQICSAACTLGFQKGVKIYEFVKEALIRKYGKAFYAKLDEIIIAGNEQRKIKEEEDNG